MVKSKPYKDKGNSVQISKKSDGQLTIAWDEVNERQWDAWMERISPCLLYTSPSPRDEL